MDAWLVVHWVASMVASRVVMLVVWKDALLVVAKVDVWVASMVVSWDD